MKCPATGKTLPCPSLQRYYNDPQDAPLDVDEVQTCEYCGDADKESNMCYVPTEQGGIVCCTECYDVVCEENEYDPQN